MDLFILETSSEKSALFFVSAGQLIAEKHWRGGPGLSKSLARDVKELLDLHRFQPDLIAVGEGPGSYTGTRVGVALAQALSFGWEIPLIGFCSLQSFIPPVEGHFISLVDAKGGGVYALFGEKRGLNCHFELPPRRLSPQEIRKEPLHLASPHSSLLQEKLGLSGIWFEVSPDAPSLIRSIEKNPSPLESKGIDYLSCVYSFNPLGTMQ